MNVFDNDEDKEKYIEFFTFYKSKLYAWCLMDNHVHFIVEPTTETGLAELFSYTHMR
ncbi:MAG: putative transposase [Glaciecola sp.]|jgi:putative transposase